MVKWKQFTSPPPGRWFLPGTKWGILCTLLALGGRLLAAESAPATPADLSTLKEQIKREVLAELCQQLGDSAEEVTRAHERLKQEIKREILDELRQEGVMSPPPTGATSAIPASVAEPVNVTPASAPTTTTAEPTPNNATAESVPVAKEVAVQFGDATGRILEHGKPLADCKVRLVRLEASRFLLMRSVKYGIEFEAVTDKDGRYSFHHIPVGGYKLRWLTPGATSWVRRIRDKPDVTVKANETSTLADVETAIAPVAESPHP